MAKNQQSNKIESKGPLSIIFLTVLIDMIGVGIVVPIIPALFFKESQLFFPAGTSSDYINLMFGLLMAAFPFMQFFGAPILGALSDKYGRKPLLKITIIGTFIGYCLMAYGILSQSLILVFIGRLLPGFTGGNISIVYSAMADISLPKDKAKNFGLVGAAFGLGFVIGPALGGVLADPSIVSWFNNSTPFVVTAILTAINMVVVFLYFPETLKVKKATKVTIFTGFVNIKKAFQTPDLRTLFIVMFLHAVGFSFFTIFFAPYLYDFFDYSQKDVGYLYGYIGLWLVFSQGVIVRKLSGKVLPKNVPKYSLLALAIGVIIVLFPQDPIWFFWIIILIPLSQSISNPFMTTILSESTSPERQGEMLGIKQSLYSLGTVITPLIGGWINTYNVLYSIVAGGVIIFLAWVIYVLIYIKKY